MARSIDATKLAIAGSRLLAGRYAFVRELGRGAEGRVVLVEDRASGAELRAVKIVPAHEVERVRWEHALLSRISHPNLARVFELIRVDDAAVGFDVARGSLALVSELAAGQSADRVARALGRDRDKRVEVAWLVLDRMAQALTALHAHGLAHGDVAPRNIVITPELTDAKLVDLGLARAPGVCAHVSGTPGFIAPEQLRGELLLVSDLYALGRSVQAILAPEQLSITSSESSSGLSAWLRAPAPMPTWVPDPLASLLASLTAQDPYARPRSATELWERVEDARGGGAQRRSGWPSEALTARARALSVTTLPFVGNDDARLRLLELLQHEEVIAVVGPLGSGRSRFARHVVGTLQAQRLDAKARPPTYQVCEDLPVSAVAHDSIVHVERGDCVTEAAASAFVRAARLAGRRCTLVLERSAELPGVPSVKLGALSQGQLAELLQSALPGLSIKAPRVREAMAAVSGLPGRLCRLLAAGLAAGQDMERPGSLRAQASHDEGSIAELSAHARALASLLAVAGGALPHAVLAACAPDALEAGTLELRALGFCSSPERSGLELRPDIAGAIARELSTTQRGQLGLQLLAAGVSGRARGLALLQAGDRAQAQSVLVDEIGVRRERGDVLGAARLAADGLAAWTGEDAWLRLLLADAERALGHYDRALETLAGVRGDDAVLMRAELLRLTGDAEASARAARPLLTSARGSAVARAAEVLLARLMLDAGDAEQALRAARPHAGTLGDGVALRAAEVSALAELRMGALEDAQHRIERAMAASRALGEHGAEARLCSVAAAVLTARGELGAAARMHARAHELADAAGEYHAAATFLVNLGTAQLEAGDLGAARATCREGARRLALLGRDRDLARVLYNRALADALTGDLEPAIDAARESASAGRASGDLVAAATATVLLAELHIDAGDTAEARAVLATLSEGSALAPFDLASVDARACVVSARLGDRSAAEAWMRTAADAAQQLPAGASGVELELELAVSALSRLGGDLAKASAAAERALAHAKQRGDCVTLLQATLAAARAAETHDRALASVRYAEVRSQLDALALTLPPEDRQRLRSLPAYRTALTALPGAVGAPREQELRYRKLAALAKRLAAETRRSRLYDIVLDAAIELSGAERGYLLWNDAEGVPRVRAGRGLDRKRIEGDAVSRSIVDRVMASGSALSTVDAAADARLSEAVSVHALALRSVLAVPMLAQGEVRGALYLEDRLRPLAFGESDVALLSDLADLAGIALESAQRLAREARALRRLQVAEQRLARQVQAQALELDSFKSADATEDFAGIVAHSVGMQEVLRLVARVAKSDVPVLLRGESGTGKELVARALHARSLRTSRAFVAENCGALPEALLESALFGHVKGAFTGADRRKIGLFEAADGGTLFLDEIGEMTPAMQTRLLRVLQDGEVRPVGGERTLRVDVRVVAATHRDLEDMVQKRAFREDLYYRLAVVTVPIPPLRERADDIAPLLQHFVAVHGDGRRRKLQRGLVERLAAQAWPGNVRQLENEVRRALVLADEELREDHFPSLSVPGARAVGAELDLRAHVDDLERRLIRRALEAAAGNQTRAAELLGVSRFGLQKMLKRLALAAK